MEVLCGRSSKTENNLGAKLHSGSRSKRPWCPSSVIPGAWGVCSGGRRPLQCGGCRETKDN
eukprot:4131237-Heterocapsa_arctica.AAC.1